MKAAIQERYGSPEVVELRVVERPTPADDQVLVRVRAASVNRADLDGQYVQSVPRGNAGVMDEYALAIERRIEAVGMVELGAPPVQRFMQLTGCARHVRQAQKNSKKTRRRR